jgi:hypothetical protein
MRSQKRREPRADRRIGVTHRPVDDDVLAERLENAGELFRLRARNGLERRLVLFPVPDFLVVARFAPRPQRQDDAVKHHLPNERVFLDDAPVAEKLFQVSTHRCPIGCIRRAEIDEKHAYAVFNRRRLARRAGICRGLGGRRSGRRRRRWLARGSGRGRLDRGCRSLQRCFRGRRREVKMFRIGRRCVGGGRGRGRGRGRRAFMLSRDSLG